MSDEEVRPEVVSYYRGQRPFLRQYLLISIPALLGASTAIVFSYVSLFVAQYHESVSFFTGTVHGAVCGTFVVEIPVLLLTAGIVVSGVRVLLCVRRSQFPRSALELVVAYGLLGYVSMHVIAFNAYGVD